MEHLVNGSIFNREKDKDVQSFLCIYPGALEMLLVLIDTDANKKMQMQMVPYCWLRTPV